MVASGGGEYLLGKHMRNLLGMMVMSVHHDKDLGCTGECGCLNSLNDTPSCMIFIVYEFYVKTINKSWTLVNEMHSDWYLQPTLK